MNIAFYHNQSEKLTMNQQRRNHLTLLMLYKIINQLVEVPNHHILAKASAFTRNSTSKYTHLYSRIDSYKFSEPSDSGTPYQIM